MGGANGKTAQGCYAELNGESPPQEPEMPLLWLMSGACVTLDGKQQENRARNMLMSHEGGPPTGVESECKDKLSNTTEGARRYSLFGYAARS